MGVDDAVCIVDSCLIGPTPQDDIDTDNEMLAKSLQRVWYERRYGL